MNARTPVGLGAKRFTPWTQWTSASLGIVSPGEPYFVNGKLVCPVFAFYTIVPGLAGHDWTQKEEVHPAHPGGKPLRRSLFPSSSVYQSTLNASCWTVFARFTRRFAKSRDVIVRPRERSRSVCWRAERLAPIVQPLIVEFRIFDV